MMAIKLSGISETMLIPVWARATETVHKRPLIRDDAAVSIISQLDYDFSRFASARLSQLGIAIRTMLLDTAVLDFLAQHPDAVVVNIGAGLDTRHDRLLPPKVCWYELDLPEAIELRRSFFRESPTYRFIAHSMFDLAWMEEIEDTEKPVLLIAEGIFMFFAEKELRELMTRLVDRFSGASMLLEVMGPALVGRSRRHDSLSTINDAPEFKWGLLKTHSLEEWHPGIQVLEEWRYFDYCKERQGLSRFLVHLPLVSKLIAPRIVHLYFKDASLNNIFHQLTATGQHQV